MFFLFVQLPALPPPEIQPPAAIVRPWATEPARPHPGPQPDVRPQQGTEPIEIKLVSDSTPAAPDWRQQFSVTINSGGTLAEAANRLWGDPSEENVNRLFEAARKKYPDLHDPSRVTAGQQFIIEIDPSRSFILSNIERLSSPDRTVRRFTNGAVETRYATPQRGILRVIDFPAEGAREFEFHDGKEIIRIPAGSTLVNYEYQAGQSFEEVVQATYGQRSVTAMVDFARKTGWRPQAWPPDPGASKQIVISRQTNYADEPITPLKVTVPDLAWQQEIDRLAGERAAAGVYPLGRDVDSTHYLVRVARDDVTLGQVAKLLFAKPTEHRAELLRAAGLASAGPGGGEDLLLQGSNFQIEVPYLAEPVVARQGEEIRLANGAWIVGSGRSLVAHYPSGYRELRYRADKWFAFLANAYQLTWETLRDPSAPKEVIQVRVEEGVAQLLWQWDPSNPRRASGDVAAWVKFQGGRPGRIAPEDVELTALLKPPDQVTAEERLAADLERFPFLIPLAGLVILAFLGAILSVLYRLLGGSTAVPRLGPRRRPSQARTRLPAGRP